MNKKRLGIGFIGGGFISRFHIQSLISVRDVDVLGVSIVQTYRSQFSGVLKKETMEQLMERMRSAGDLGA